MTVSLDTVRARQAETLRFMASHPFCKHADGFLEYRPLVPEPRLHVVCFTGRGVTPETPLVGMHQVAAHAAMRGCAAVVASAHGRSRRAARTWLLDAGDARIVILGHSHGGDHASELAAEYFAKSGRPVQVLCTVDPVNSPGPWPLKRIRKRAAAEEHINYFQRNAPWFGGSIKRADVNTEVSDPEVWPAWSLRLRHPEIRGFGITHTTIDEDLFLNGDLTRFWERTG